MVGAVTTLILIVAVFLAYNANNGLPFVPVYSVSVDVPNAARLGANNEVRIGGTRVGVVESIEPVEIEEGGTASTEGDGTAGDVPPLGARLNLKLDKAAEPLPEDSVFRVRYRSTFGLKYLEIVRGTGPDAEEGHIFDGTNDGDAAECDIPTDPASFSDEIPEQAKDGCFQEQTEFDAINNTFDNKTRSAARENLVGFGGAFAGRGASLNDAIEGLRPLVENLGPVSRVLADPSTQLERFIVSLARTAEIVAPVSDQQAQFFTNAAIAFDAIARDPEALKATISEGPPTLETAIDTLPRQRPFLAEFAELSRRLRPGVQDLRVALPVLNSAIDVGTPILARTPAMNRDLREVLVELDDLVAQSSTALSLPAPPRHVRLSPPVLRVVRPGADRLQLLELLVHVPPRGALRQGPGGLLVPPGPHERAPRPGIGPRGAGDDHGPGRDARSRRRLLGHPGHRPARAPAQPGRRWHVRARGSADSSRQSLRPHGPEGRRLPGRPDRLLPRPPADSRPAGVEPERRASPTSPARAARRPSTTARTRSSRTARLLREFRDTRVPSRQP